LDEQESQGGPWLQRTGQSPRTGRVKARQSVRWRQHRRSAVRGGNHCRQDRAEVLIITDGQPFDGAVLAFGHEEHVEQAKNAAAAQTINLGQDPVLRTGGAAEAQGEHLERCGHHCPPCPWPLTSPTVPPGALTAGWVARATSRYSGALAWSDGRC